MRTLLELARPDGIAPTRILFLPAAFTAPEDFVRAGFVNAVRQRQLPIDLVLAELNFQHLTDRTILRRLRHELVLPARAMGCTSIHLCGISIGGFIALAYAERYTTEIDGLCLLAPYLGNHMVTGEIERANGLDGWQPGELAPDDDERRLWRFIKGYRTQPVALHLGFGSEDRFAASQRMMAAALPAESVQVVPGGHDWPVWRQLWDDYLDKILASRLVSSSSDVSASNS